MPEFPAAIIQMASIDRPALDWTLGVFAVLSMAANSTISCSGLRGQRTVEPERGGASSAWRGQETRWSLTMPVACIWA